jgi:hypothetical protein
MDPCRATERCAITDPQAAERLLRDIHSSPPVHTTFSQGRRQAPRIVTLDSYATSAPPGCSTTTRAARPALTAIRAS